MSPAIRLAPGLKPYVGPPLLAWPNAVLNSFTGDDATYSYQVILAAEAHAGGLGETVGTRTTDLAISYTVGGVDVDLYPGEGDVLVGALPGSWAAKEESERHPFLVELSVPVAVGSQAASSGPIRLAYADPNAELSHLDGHVAIPAGLASWTVAQEQQPLRDQGKPTTGSGDLRILVGRDSNHEWLDGLLGSGCSAATIANTVDAIVADATGDDRWRRVRTFQPGPVSAARAVALARLALLHWLDINADYQIRRDDNCLVAVQSRSQLPLEIERLHALNDLAPILPWAQEWSQQLRPLIPRSAVAAYVEAVNEGSASGWPGASGLPNASPLAVNGPAVENEADDALSAFIANGIRDLPDHAAVGVEPETAAPVEMPSGDTSQHWRVVASAASLARLQFMPGVLPAFREGRRPLTNPDLEIASREDGDHAVLRLVPDRLWPYRGGNGQGAVPLLLLEVIDLVTGYTDAIPAATGWRENTEGERWLEATARLDDSEQARARSARTDLVLRWVDAEHRVPVPIRWFDDAWWLNEGRSEPAVQYSNLTRVSSLPLAWKHVKEGSEELPHDGGDVLETIQAIPVDREADPVKDYLRQIGQVPLLSAEQELELAKRIKVGLRAEGTLADEVLASKCPADQLAEIQHLVADGRRAKNHLVEANLRLVVALARRYTGRGMLFLDLIQEGNLGLIRAVEEFDPEKGYRFATYATWWIRQAITRALAGQSRTGRPPVSTVEVVNSLARVQRQMIQDLGREPTPEELAKKLGVTPERIVQVQRHGGERIWLLSALRDDAEAIGPADLVSIGVLQELSNQDSDSTAQAPQDAPVPKTVSPDP